MATYTYLHHLPAALRVTRERGGSVGSANIGGCYQVNALIVRSTNTDDALQL